MSSTIPSNLIPTALSQEPAASAVTGADLIWITQNGTSYKATIAQALAAAGSAPSTDTFFLLNSDVALLPNSRVLRFNSTQFSATDAGAGSTYTYALNYASVITPLSDAAAAVVGTSLVPSRSDHQHPINVSGVIPLPLAGTGAVGTSSAYARSDHQHPLPPAFVGATAGVDGTLGGVVKPLAGQQLSYLRGDGTWQIASGTGTVTSIALSMPAIFSVAGSPISTAGTLAVTLATELANTVWAGPTSGAALAPTFRALVAADIPSLPASIITSGTLALAVGGTNANLTASTGGIVYSGASALAILAGTATGAQMLQSGASAAPVWSTATWPATTTINQLLFSSSANTVTGLSTANSGVLITSSGGVPSISSTIPSATQDNITRTGTLVSGATGAGFTLAIGTSTISGVLLGANGGTGVANTGSTITLGGNLTTSGAFASTFTMTNTTSVTFPTAGTLATLAGAETLTNKTITTFGGALTFNPANLNFTLSPTGTGTGAISPATAGSINNMTLGITTPLAAKVTTMTATGVATFSNGTAGAPGITFAQQATDGIYGAGAGHVGITAAGNQVADFAAGSSTTFLKFAGNTSPLLFPGSAVTDTNFIISSKGAGSVYLETGSSARITLEAADTASGVNYSTFTGSATGAPGSVTWGAANSSDANVNLVATPKGTAAFTTTNAIIRGLFSPRQAAPAAKTTSTTLTAAEIIAGMITANQGGGAGATYTLPLGSDLAAALPADYTTNDGFFFSVVNISTNVLEIATIAGNTGTTLVGGGGVLANSAAGVASSATFRVRQTGASTFSIYRVS